MLADNSNNSIVLQVKGNQQNLLDEVYFASKFSPIIDRNETLEKGHGRVETRLTKTFAININGWEEAVLGCTVLRNSSKKVNNRYVDEHSNSYYICNRILSADIMQIIIRGHWSIESTNHNIRDTVLFEDANKIRIKPENMMVIRSFGYNIIQANLKKKNFTAQMESHKLNFSSLFRANGVKFAKLNL